jgi:hypothetical protein
MVFHIVSDGRGSRFLAVVALLAVGLLSGCASLVPPPAPESFERSVETGIPARAAYSSALAWFERDRGGLSVESYSADPAAGIIRFRGLTELSARDSVITYVEHRSELRVEEGKLRFHFGVERAFSLDYDLSRGMPGAMREDPANHELRFTQALYDAFAARAEAFVEGIARAVAAGGNR